MIIVHKPILKKNAIRHLKLLLNMLKSCPIFWEQDQDDNMGGGESAVFPQEYFYWFPENNQNALYVCIYFTRYYPTPNVGIIWALPNPLTLNTAIPQS